MICATLKFLHQATKGFLYDIQPVTLQYSCDVLGYNFTLHCSSRIFLVLVGLLVTDICLKSNYKHSGN